jgi:hypothetical protein
MMWGSRKQCRPPRAGAIRSALSIAPGSAHEGEEPVPGLERHRAAAKLVDTNRPGPWAGRFEAALFEACVAQPVADLPRDVDVSVSGPDNPCPVRAQLGSATIVCRMSESAMLPKTPQRSTRSAGTAPAYASPMPASPHTTSSWSSPAFAIRSRVRATSVGSSSTRRPQTSTGDLSRSRTSRRSRSPPAQTLTTRAAPLPARIARKSPMCFWTVARRRESGDPESSYGACQSTQFVGDSPGLDPPTTDRTLARRLDRFAMRYAATIPHTCSAHHDRRLSWRRVRTPGGRVAPR